MVKFCGHYITCQEVPGEISLTFSISRCPHRCEGCHSPWLQADIGDELTVWDIDYYIQQYWDGITCVCFMGTGGDNETVAQLAERGTKHFFLAHLSQENNRPDLALDCVQKATAGMDVTIQVLPVYGEEIITVPLA